MQCCLFTAYPADVVSSAWTSSSASSYLREDREEDTAQVKVPDAMLLVHVASFQSLVVFACMTCLGLVHMLLLQCFIFAFVSYFRIPVCFAVC